MPSPVNYMVPPMQKMGTKKRAKSKKKAGRHGCGRRLAILTAICAVWPAGRGFCESASGTDDPLLDLFIQKGFVTQAEAEKVKAEADSIRTNGVANISGMQSKWKIGDGIKSVELFGDIRLRYESRSATDPGGDKIELNRLRYAARVGLRGELFDDYYYGFRLETSTNPRSSWVTFGSSSTGPFGKSTAGVNIGQIYLGWRPESWMDVTLGKMPNPLYTSTLVWDPSLNPEGAAERFKHSVGNADFFVTLGQFLYQDTNPTQASPGFFNPLSVNSSSLPFLLAWQGGVNYHFSKSVAFKVEPVFYQYIRLNDGHSPYNSFSPDYSGTYVGQGSTIGINGVPVSYNLASPGFDGFYSNETGINNLSILEIPFELDMKLKKLDLELFGDFAENLQGAQRATAAYNAANSSYFSIANGIATTLSPISSPQVLDDKAYQIGFAIAGKDSLGLAAGSPISKKNAWEFRTYWQHIGQYALDPNLIDADVFEGAENLEGIYAAFAYSLSENMTGTIHYGHATRINKMLGTGGSDPDIPQMNPINSYDLFQVDLTFRF